MPSQPGYNDNAPSGTKVRRVQNYSPEQMKLFQQLFSHTGPDSYLNKLAMGDEDMFNQIEAPALRQFNSLQGNIASKFSGMGMGARRSSGFNNEINSAASNLAMDLQSQRQSLQRQAINDLMGFSNMLLGQKPYTTSLQQKSQGGGFGGLVGGALGGAAGFFAGGPAGAIAGAQFGYGLGNNLSGGQSQMDFNSLGNIYNPQQAPLWGGV